MPRAARLVNIRDLFRSTPGGFTARELADLNGVHVRTIQRDLLLLQTEMGLPLLEDAGRYRALKEQRLPPLEITLQEARALLIATRLFVRFSDEADLHAASALEKIARVMPEPVRAQVVAAAEAIRLRRLDADFARTMATVTEAWARRRVLRLSYRSAGRSRPREVLVQPYFLEPSAAGFSTYLIGYSETHAAMRTFKVERIVSAEALPRGFEISPDVRIDTLLASAWGIIWGEGVQVRLRFAPDVAWRVKESHWHPSQEIEEIADGGCVLTMTVASVMELGRWVRSWGDKVEVLAPPSLRQELREEAVRLARLYAARPRPARRARPQRGAARGPGSVA